MPADIRTISYDQNEILRWIMDLYLEGKPFEIDPTYSTGQFYKHGIPEPEIKSDINPQVDGCMEIDVTDMPWPDNSIRSCIFDPPFLCGFRGEGKEGKMRSRFSSYKNPSALYEFYNAALNEIYRILRLNGILVFKCQDIIDSSKQFWSHIVILEKAIKIGFVAEDLFILLAKSRMFNWKRQLHARKYHCYFWVFRKPK